MAVSLGTKVLRHFRINKQIGICIVPRVVHPASTFSNDAPRKKSEPEEVGRKTISKAMRLYLERSREHDEFMKKERVNFSIGKRHLANMMGEDPETFNQEDIDRSIEYLFPSGVFDPRARPIMRPPEQIFPEKKAAEFDESGRPHHFLFYTGRPNYYQQLFDLVTITDSLNKYEDELIKQNKCASKENELDLSGSEWIPKDKLEEMLVETLSDREYENFVKAMERLISHPFASRIKDHIFKFRKLLMSQTKSSDIPKPEVRADGKSVITVTGATRKTAEAQATITYPGTGNIRINGMDILYFTNVQSREQVSSNHSMQPEGRYSDIIPPTILIPHIRYGSLFSTFFMLISKKILSSS